ncbi:Nuclear distribution protein PAC1 [Frankliniella fusca]|uniref:Nuclear distribution protein PAC1 n=1 Tax=Frankliniella fusca TaxID=407009 RepID=A0AAE1HI92_9NEOP|nr:Nuclear distribution protein PAC1 [Frankliniella fusca]KAK3924110.1 Nuclear distribution protein PAC1 [Frankliniella fusca]
MADGDSRRDRRRKRVYAESSDANDEPEPVELSSDLSLNMSEVCMDFTIDTPDLSISAGTSSEDYRTCRGPLSNVSVQISGRRTAVPDIVSGCSSETSYYLGEESVILEESAEIIGTLNPVTAISTECPKVVEARREILEGETCFCSTRELHPGSLPEDPLTSDVFEPGKCFEWITWDIPEDEYVPPTIPQYADMNMCVDSTADYFEQPMEQSDIPLPQEDKIYPEALLSLKESMTAILSFAKSEKISGAGLGRLLSLIKLHLPEENNFFKSSDDLFKVLAQQDEPISVFYFCSNCLKDRSSSTDLCDVCTDDSRSVQYYVSLPILPQIRKLYRRPGFLHDIQYRKRRTKQNPNNVEDVYDGELYKAAEQDILSELTNISLMWNTDGLQIFNSTSFSLWPWYFVVNELPPEKRYLSENMLIAGIWGSATKPHPNVYLKPIHRDVKLLEKGIKVQFYGDVSWHLIRGCVLCGTCDAPARALFMNMKIHSGFYSCPVCYLRGEKADNTSPTVFPYEEGVKLRNLDDYYQEVKYAVDNKVLINTALQNDNKCCGVKGPTLLSYLVPNFFSAMAIDSMHCVYLGVMRQLLHLFFDKIHNTNKEPFSIYTKIELVSSRLKHATPPHYLQRNPQTIEKLIYWKASELRSFLFNLSVCVLNDVLKPEYFEHFLMFVEGVALLNSNSVSAEDLRVSTILLNQFVAEFSSKYGPNNMSHNVHMLLHLPRTVKLIAPLCVTSCFQFEDMNGRIAKLIHGTRHASLQITGSLSVISDLPLLVHELQNQVVQTYCKELQQKRLPLKITAKIEDGIYCVGDLENIESGSFQYLVPTFQNTNVKLYHRLLSNRLLYVSCNYGRGRRVSSYVKYSRGDEVFVGNVECFVQQRICQCATPTCPCSVEHLAVIKRLHVLNPFQTGTITVSHIFQCTETDLADIFPVRALQCVMFKVQIGDIIYLIDNLNSFERE